MTETPASRSDPEFGVSAAINRQPATTTPDRPVEEVAIELLGKGLSGMVVLDGDGALVGVVSEYDVLTRKGRTVGEIMSRGVISATEDVAPAELARLMGLHGIRLVPILRDGRLVGVVSRADLIRLYATTGWRCQTCGATERGLARPDRCAVCDATGLALERTDA